MRKITLSTDADFDTKSILLAIVKAPMAGGQQGGTSVEVMRRDIRLLDVLEPAEPRSEVNIEEADWVHLKQKLEVYPFAISDRRIIALADSVINAPTA